MESNNNLPKPVLKNGQFDNPWPGWKLPSVKDVLKWKTTHKNKSKIPNQKVLNQTLPVVNPDFNFQPNELSLTWIGHASCLVRIEGLTILTDPVFSTRASFSQWVGPSRYRPAAVPIEDLPQVDSVVISHNHYDHLDYNSIRGLNARFGPRLQWFVPLGTKQWMTDCGCSNVVELDWWASATIPTRLDVQFILTPAQHWTLRGPSDERKALWGSWTVIGPNKRFYFAGDTGYCPVFKQIGQSYGPFDLAAIPIGAYEPRWFMGPQHVDPEQAVLIHQDIRAKLSVGIHWGTFDLASEFYLEPPLKLKEALNKHKLQESEFITVSHGQTFKL